MFDKVLRACRTLSREIFEVRMDFLNFLPAHNMDISKKGKPMVGKQFDFIKFSDF